MSTNILIAIAWPYANAPIHVGNITGSHLPGDIVARYHRLKGDRVLVVSGTDSHGTPVTLRADAEGLPVDTAAAETEDAFELLIFRGFSSSVTHPTAFDPDRPALPEGAVITSAELLAGPLHPLQERRLAGPQPVEAFLTPTAWIADDGTGEGR